MRSLPDYFSRKVGKKLPRGHVLEVSERRPSVDGTGFYVKPRYLPGWTYERNPTNGAAVVERTIDELSAAS